MRVATRNRTYYAGDLRRDVMQQALTAVAEAGVASVSLRDLARRLGVSHAAPHNHFPDKRALFTALATDGLQRLAATIAEFVERAGEDPLERLAASGRAYLRFAAEHAAAFDVIWRVDVLNVEDSDYRRAAGSLDAGFTDIVVAALGRGRLSHEDPAQLVLLAWAFPHGLAMLHSAGAVRSDFPGVAREAIDDAHVDLMVRVMRAAVGPAS